MYEAGIEKCAERDERDHAGVQSCGISFFNHSPLLVKANLKEGAVNKFRVL